MIDSLSHLLGLPLDSKDLKTGENVKTYEQTNKKPTFFVVLLPEDGLITLGVFSVKYCVTLQTLAVHIEGLINIDYYN